MRSLLAWIEGPLIRRRDLLQEASDLITQLREELHESKDQIDFWQREALEAHRAHKIVAQAFLYTLDNEFDEIATRRRLYDAIMDSSDHLSRLEELVA